MPSITRIFTATELEEIGVPHECSDPDGTPADGLAVELENEQTSSSRWYETRRLIFRAPDDGRAYAVRYRTGLTEEQEIEPFEHLGDGVVIATAMEERQVTVTRWQPVQAPAADPA